MLRRDVVSTVILVKMLEKEKSCFYYDQTVFTLTVSYSTCSIMAFMYAEGLGGRQLGIKIVVTSKFEGVLNMDGVSCNFWKKEIKGKRYIWEHRYYEAPRHHPWAGHNRTEMRHTIVGGRFGLATVRRVGVHREGTGYLT